MVIFETKFNKETVKQVSKKQIDGIKFLFIYLSIVFIGVGTLNLFVFGDENFIMGLAFILIGVLFIIFVSAIPKLILKNAKTQSTISDDTMESYQFDEDKFEIHQYKNDEYEGITKAKYSYFYKVIENAEYFYLYISNAQMHLVPKNSLVEGSIEEFRRILKRNMDPSKLKLFIEKETDYIR